jgi:hypothetical protein
MILHQQLYECTDKSHKKLVRIAGLQDPLHQTYAGTIYTQ